MLSRHSHPKLLVLLWLIGCGETTAPPERAQHSDEPSLDLHGGHHSRPILLIDFCGGDSWTAFGGCLINGTVSRPDWLARVQATGSHPLWLNWPAATRIETGTTVQVRNVGGRTHSFTRVVNFGGGIIPLLNTRDDTRIPAPECLSGIVNIPGAGGSITHTFTGVGTQRYQCCFHPWMRTTVRVTHSHDDD